MDVGSDNRPRFPVASKKVVITLTTSTAMATTTQDDWNGAPNLSGRITGFVWDVPDTGRGSNTATFAVLDEDYVEWHSKAGADHNAKTVEKLSRDNQFEFNSVPTFTVTTNLLTNLTQTYNVYVVYR